MSTKYTLGFKEQAVQKALAQGAVSQKVMAEELNVGYSTLQKWIRDYKKMNQKTDNIKQRRPSDWISEERLQALLETVSLNVEQRSQYCREKGIFPHHLDEWRSNFINAGGKSVLPGNAELKELKEKNSLLEKELRRKDKALAETAALLVLQKKFQALLEEKE